MFKNIFLTFFHKTFGQLAGSGYLCIKPINNLFYLKIFYL